MEKNKAINMEIIEFLLDNNHYGINASFVKEIIDYQRITPVPNVPPNIEGVFMPRNQMITAVDLKYCLQLGSSVKKGFFIVTQLEGMEIAFHIDNVVGIHKILPDDIIGLGFSEQENGYAEGVLKKEDILIILLNIAKIVQDINQEIAMEAVEMEEVKIKETENKEE